MNSLKYNQYQKILELNGKRAPHAEEIEKTVLGTFMMYEETFHQFADRLTVEHFYIPRHQVVFNIMLEQSKADKPFDLLALEQKIDELRLVDANGEPMFIADIINFGFTGNTEYNVQILVEKYLKRKVILDCYKTLSEAYDPSTDPYDLLDHGEEKFTSIRSNLETKEAKLVGDFILQRLNSLEERQNCKGLVGIPSGIKALDEKTAGWQNGDLVIIAGRPSMGKTAFVLTAARNATDSIEFENKSVAIFSMEMGNDSLTDRLLAMEAGVSGEKMRNGTLSEAEVILVHEAASRLYNRKILLDDTSGLNLNQLKNKAKKLARTQNIGMIIVDYIGLMDGLGEKTREQEIAVASRGLKRLAKELNVPIIVLSQLSRLVEQRGGSKRPMLSDLRDSGSIEQDADIVLFLYRPEYYNVKIDEEGQPTAGIAEIIIAKQRNGATGSVKAGFIKEQGEFRNLVPESFLKGLDLTPTKAA